MSRGLFVVALVASVACQHASGPKRPVIGVSLLTETHTFFKELERGLRDVGRGEVGPAVGAVVLALEVVVAADGAEHAVPRGYSTVQVSPDRSALARLPIP